LCLAALTMMIAESGFSGGLDFAEIRRKLRDLWEIDPCAPVSSVYNAFTVWVMWCEAATRIDKT
jgi:hypothetical protein